MKFHIFTVKIIMVLFLNLLVAPLSYANPIPVFCLAGWIEGCKDKGYDDVRTYDAAGNRQNSYELFGSTIRKYGPGYEKLKSYDLFGSTISEYGPRYEKLKSYDLFGSTISEYDAQTGIKLKTYDLN